MTEGLKGRKEEQVVRPLLYTMELKWDIVLVTLILMSLTMQRLAKIK